jgi:hypothetical protein
MGVGRRYTGVTDLLTPRQLQLPGPPLPDFARLRAEAQRLKLQMAARDNLVASVPPPAPPHGITPKEAGYPIPFLSPADQARRAREKKQLQEKVLAEYNQSAKADFLPACLRQALSKPKVKLQAVPARPDSFMPTSFWKSQNPTGSKKVGWAQCCNTVKKMVGYNSPMKDRIQIVRERGKSLALQPTANAGLAMLDTYMALHKPVMAGVNHTYGLKYNEKTTDHFVAIVGTGTDAKGKYYRFFDVGVSNKSKSLGTDWRNRLYYDKSTGSYYGKSYATGNYYTISQLRFKPGTF